MSEPTPQTQSSLAPSEGFILRAVTKRFGSQEAVHDVDLDVARGEFFTMLGPSGFGKTTLLRGPRLSRGESLGISTSSNV